MDDHKDKSDNHIDDVSNQINDLEAKIAELENNWKRALADYRNLEKRMQEERVQGMGFANEILIQNLLPVLDHLEMLDKHLNDDGLKLILKDFKQTLTSAGLTEIETQDKDFDPNTMEAIELSEGEKNKVTEVLLKGYLLNDKLIRPARVKVGAGENKEEK
jgi:molecular chaperone GrpE